MPIYVCLVCLALLKKEVQKTGHQRGRCRDAEFMEVHHFGSVIEWEGVD